MIYLLKKDESEEKSDTPLSGHRLDFTNPRFTLVKIGEPAMIDERATRLELALFRSCPQKIT
jgi:hypothetical protein